MTRAEHSHSNHSAPHGASRAVKTPVSPAKSCFHSSVLLSAAAFSNPLPALGQEFSPGLSRRTVSGRALIAVLALGLLVETAPRAGATPVYRSQGSRTTQNSASATKNGGDDWPGVLLAPRTRSMPAALIPTVPKPKAAAKTTAKIAVAKAAVAKTVIAKNVMAKAAIAPNSIAPFFPSAVAPKTPAPQKMKAASSSAIVQNIGGGKVIRFAQLTPEQTALPAAPALVAPRRVADNSLSPNSFVPTKNQATSNVAFRVVPVAPTPVGLTSSAPAPVGLTSSVPAPAKRSLARQALASKLGAMKKVIDVPTLSLPPLSKPLPRWMQNASVKIDRLEKKPLRPAPPRFAQNPGAPPLRNPNSPVTNSDRLPNQIEVAVSTFVVLLTKTDLQTVAVADPAIADVAVVNSRSVLLNGKSAGVTSLVIVDGQKIRQYTVRVTASPGSRQIDIAAAIGIPGVSVRFLKDAIVLEGEVANAEEARRATEIAAIYATKIVNQLSIRGQVSQEAGTAAQLRDLIGLPNVNVRVSGDTAILSGTVDSPQQIQDADVIARTVSKNVINQLRLPNLTIDQVRESLGALSVAPVGSSIAGPSAPGVFNAPSPLVMREAGGSIIVEGSVASQAQLDQILGLAARTGIPVLNRIQAPTAFTADQGTLSIIAQAIGRPGVRVSGSTKRLVLEGVVADTEEAVAVEQIARAYAIQVDNLLQTPNPRLVDVDVSIVEITKTGLKNLGFTFPSLLDASGSGFVLGQSSINSDLPGPLPIAGTGASVRQTAFQAALRAEITNQNVRLLSSPRTTVLSGRTATFQVGGQVPVPVAITQSLTGTITSIAFKDFGVLVDVVPNASANGAVTMRVKTEISEPDASIGFQPVPGAGIIPGFRRRAATTEVTTGPGGTIALGGLISTNTRELVRKVSILSRIPILGSLFTSKRFQNDQTELVIFVTPRVLPNPLPRGTTAAAGVVAVGNNTNVGTVLGNPGLNTVGVGANAGAGAGVSQ